MNNFCRSKMMLAVGFVACYMVAVDNCVSQDWPALRGADGKGVVAGSGTIQSSAVQLKVRWKKEIGSGYSSVVVVGGKAFTMYSSGENDVIGCFDSKNGETIWEFPLDEKFKGENGSFDGPISTPAVHGGHIYGLSCQGRLVCVNIEAGKMVWQKSLVDDFKSKMPLYGFATSPIVVDEQLVLQVGAKDKMLVGFDLETGDELWSCGNDQIDSQSPADVEIGGKPVILATGKKVLYGVEPGSGNVLFEFEHNAGNGMAMVPVQISDETVLLTLDDSFSKSVKLTLNADGKIKAEESWENRSIKNTYNIPALCDGNLYGFSTRILTCVDPANGDPHWKSRKPGDGFLIVVDNHLVIVTKEGGLHVATATPDKYNEIAKLKLFEDLVWTVPSFSDGAVYIRSLGEIACVDFGAADQPDVAANKTNSLPLGASFANFLDRVENGADDGAKKKIVDIFLAQQTSFPIVDSDIAHFVYRGPEEDVALACDAFGARQERKMVPVDGTDLKYYSLKLLSDQRANYVFLVNFKPQTDVLNPRKMTSSMYAGEMEFAVRLRNDAPLEMSWFGMQDWNEPKFLKSLPEKMSGKIVQRQLELAEGQPKLPIDVYLPPSYQTDESKRFPVVYVFAAPGMQSSQFVESADYLFENSIDGIRPAIIVIPKGRMMPKTEERLVPFIDQEFRTLADRNNRSLIGFGFSAGPAFGALGNQPDWFGAISTQSPLVFDVNSVLKPMEELKETTRVYLDWGRFDMHNPVENWDLRKSSKEIYEALGKNSNVELSGGMVNDSVDWASWRNRYDKVLSVLTKTK